MCVSVEERHWIHLTHREQSRVRKQLLHQGLLERLGGEYWKTVKQLRSMGQMAGEVSIMFGGAIWLPDHRARCQESI